MHYRKLAVSKVALVIRQKKKENSKKQTLYSFCDTFKREDSESQEQENNLLVLYNLDK